MSHTVMFLSCDLPRVQLWYWKHSVGTNMELFGCLFVSVEMYGWERRKKKCQSVGSRTFVSRFLSLYGSVTEQSSSFHLRTHSQWLTTFHTAFQFLNWQDLSLTFNPLFHYLHRVIFHIHPTRLQLNIHHTTRSLMNRQDLSLITSTLDTLSFLILLSFGWFLFTQLTFLIISETSDCLNPSQISCSSSDIPFHSRNVNNSLHTAYFLNNLASQQTNCLRSHMSTSSSPSKWRIIKSGIHCLQWSYNAQ